MAHPVDPFGQALDALEPQKESAPNCVLSTKVSLETRDMLNAIAEQAGVSGHRLRQMIFEAFLEDFKRGRFGFQEQTETLRTVSLVRR